jgi:cytochrome c peroxidase
VFFKFTNSEGLHPNSTMSVWCQTSNFWNFLVIALASSLAACGGGNGGSAEPRLNSSELLGEALFNDSNLSLNRTQSCATCHDPDHGFIDSRNDNSGQTSAVSLGDDGLSLGDRNAPTVTYAAFSPSFRSGSRSRFNSQQDDYSGFIGGQFHDGRAPDLPGQAAAPFLNPIEMGMPDEASVVARLQENSDYVAAFEFLFGKDVFNDTAETYRLMTEAIASFEETPALASFDSKYDRSLLDSDDPNYFLYDPLSKAARGKSLFFSQQFTNCATCHQLRPVGNSRETFSGYEYHNIGVPINEAVRLSNGSTAGFVDEGLLDNPNVDDAAQRGKFKVPTLRNVAVTAPYMHNGVFRELKTVVQFYDHFLTGSRYTVNPESGDAWADPEIADTISTTELLDGGALDDDEVEALVCFLRTLTDARYEALIPDDGIDCD